MATHEGHPRRARRSPSLPPTSSVNFSPPAMPTSTLGRTPPALHSPPHRRAQLPDPSSSSSFGARRSLQRAITSPPPRSGFPLPRSLSTSAAFSPKYSRTEASPHSSVRSLSRMSSLSSLSDFPIASGALSPTVSSHGDSIFLDVGGTLFRTTRTTLAAEPESMLARISRPNSPFMNAGVRRTEGASGESVPVLFIDRDPSHFQVILNHFRSGYKAVLPMEPAVLHELHTEADFYGLSGLQERLERRIYGLTGKYPPNSFVVRKRLASRSRVLLFVLAILSSHNYQQNLASISSRGNGNLSAPGSSQGDLSSAAIAEARARRRARKDFATWEEWAQASLDSAFDMWDTVNEHVDVKAVAVPLAVTAFLMLASRSSKGRRGGGGGKLRLKSGGKLRVGRSGASSASRAAGRNFGKSAARQARAPSTMRARTARPTPRIRRASISTPSGASAARQLASPSASSSSSCAAAAISGTLVKGGLGAGGSTTAALTRISPNALPRLGDAGQRVLAEHVRRAARDGNAARVAHFLLTLVQQANGGGAAAPPPRLANS